MTVVLLAEEPVKRAAASAVGRPVAGVLVAEVLVAEVPVAVPMAVEMLPDEWLAAVPATAPQAARSAALAEEPHAAVGRHVAAAPAVAARERD